MIRVVVVPQTDKTSADSIARDVFIFFSPWHLMGGYRPVRLGMDIRYVMRQVDQ
jgi:hypothetical protein